MSFDLIIEGSSSAGDFAAWIVAIVAFAGLLWSIFWNRRRVKEQHKDEFWFAEVIGPKCIKPVLDLQAEWFPRVSTLSNPDFDDDELRRFVSDFQDAKNDALDLMWLSKLFSEDFYSTCCDALDGLEDAVAEALSGRYADGQVAGSVVQLRYQFDQTFLKVLKECRKLDPISESK